MPPEVEECLVRRTQTSESVALRFPGNDSEIRVLIGAAVRRKSVVSGRNSVRICRQGAGGGGGDSLETGLVRGMKNRRFYK